MQLTELLQGLGRFVSFPPQLAKLTGVKECVLLTQLLYWHGKQADTEGWVYKTQSDIGDETGLSDREQVTARKHLKARGLLEEKEDRLAHKMFYRVNQKALDDLWCDSRIAHPAIPESRSGGFGDRAVGDPSIEHKSTTSEYIIRCGEGGGDSESEAKTNARRGREIAKIVLGYLNQKANRKFTECDTHLSGIAKRLAEVDFDLEGVKKMIDRQIALWNDTPQQEYLQPSTLFRPSNFPGYYDKRDDPLPPSGPTASTHPRFIGLDQEGAALRAAQREAMASGKPIPGV